MKIIISPTKKMKVRDDDDRSLQTPLFTEKHDELFHLLSEMGPEELQKLYGCSKKTMQPVYEEFQRQKSGILPPLTPALLAYDGIAFRYLAPGVFDDEEWDYVRSHLRILSAMYGMLRPDDGVMPYRLEMAQKLPFSLYDFWGDDLSKAIDDPVIINLASKEYASAIRPYQPVIDVRFYEEDSTGKRKEKGVYAKMARGAMVRYLAENRIEDPSGMMGFTDFGYRYDPEASDPACFVFVRKDECRDK